MTFDDQIAKIKKHILYIYLEYQLQKLTFVLVYWKSITNTKSFETKAFAAISSPSISPYTLSS